MKALLGFMMVTMLSGIAAAALQLDVTDGKVTVSGKLEMDMFLGLFACDGATLSNFVIGPAAPSNIWIPNPDPIPIEFPEGCNGKWQYFGTFPGEDYKEGVYWMADVAFAKSQDSRSWDEIVTEGCPQGWFKVRTWTEVTEIEMGTLSLASLTTDADGNVSEAAALGTNVVNNRTVISSTFVEGDCVPEPMTLALLSLGMVLIRRGRGINS